MPHYRDRYFLEIAVESALDKSEATLAAGHDCYNIFLVVCILAEQPARPSGRSGRSLEPQALNPKEGNSSLLGQQSRLLLHSGCSTF